MILQWMRSYWVKFILAFFLLFPFATFAQVLHLTATSPFPSSMLVGTTAAATYTVSNTSPQSTVIPINQSVFPSGLSVSATTCGPPLGPGQSCTISLMLGASTTPQVISTDLKIWAKPTADAARMPISVIFTNPVVTPSAGANGSISPASAVSVSYNGSATFTATPNSGYGVDEWYVDGGLVQTGGTTYTINNVTTNHTISVTFIARYTVTGTGDAGVTVSPATQTVNSGSSILFTATALTNYAVNQWFVDGVLVQTGGTTYTVSAIVANHALTVTSIPTFVITPTAGSNGSISPSTPQTVNSGATQVLTATPSAGYSVYQWTDNSVVSQTGGTTYTLTNITANHTIEVSFGAPVGLIGGIDLTNGLFPAMVATSTNAGATWSYKAIAGNAATGHFNASSCSGVGANAVCVAAGDQAVNNVTLAATLVAASTDGGLTWTVKIPSGALPATGNYYSASCTGAGVNIRCVAAGQNTVGATAPLLVVSPDAATNWLVRSITGGPAGAGILRGAGCTGSGSTAICAVAGQDSATTAPFLAVSLDGTNTFNGVTPSGILPTNGIYYTASCTGTTGAARCIAAGQNVGTSAPLIVASNDGTGANWSLVINPSPATGIFYGSSCTGTGSSAICIAVGQNLSTSAALIAASTDGASTWTYPTISGVSLGGIFYSASCTGTGTTAVCSASGIDTVSSAPLLAVSTDGAVTWTAVAIPGVATGTLFGTGCTGNSNTAVCTAAGVDAGSGAPLLVTSVNGGTTWGVVGSIAGVPAITTGTFYGASSTGGTLTHEE